MRRLLLLACMLMACSDGTGPGHDAELHDVIVVRSNRSGDQDQLYMVRPDGTGLERILAGTGKVQGVPAVSRDGRMVAYNDTTCRVWIQEYPAGTPVEAFRVESCPFFPRWSHDGRLAATRDGNLIVMDTVGGTPITVLDDQYQAYWLDWHPTQNRMAFSSQRPEGWAIYELDLATGNVSQLVDTPGTESSVRWNPQGSRLSYGIEPSIADSITPGLWMFDLTSGTDTLLVEDVACPCPWSPDGRYLIFNRGGLGPPGAMVRLEVATGEEVPILERPPGILDLQPDWAW